MAKVTDTATTGAPAASAPASVLAGGAIKLAGFELPQATRVGGTGEFSTQYTGYLNELSLPAGAAHSADPVAVEIVVPAGTKPDEVEKVKKEEAKRISNRVTNAAKKFKGRKFVTRQVHYEGKDYIGIWEVPFVAKEAPAPVAADPAPTA